MPEPPRCSYCRERPVHEDYRPFCSPRCRMADLGRWLAGDYRIPGASRPDSSEADLGDEPGEDFRDR